MPKPFRQSAEFLSRSNTKLGENDRSSTGYVEPPRFWEIVAKFFGNPHESVLGWERAIDAQTRIRNAILDCVAVVKGRATCAFSRMGESERSCSAI